MRVLLAAVPAAIAQSCASDWDCSYNGECRGAAKDNVTVYSDQNNVFGRACTHATCGTAKADTAVVKWLGDFDTTPECEAACAKYRGANGDVCRSFTHHLPTFKNADYARGCYAVVDGSWAPHGESLVNSGRRGGGGVCACYPQWKGPHCEQLALLPTPRNAGYQPVMNASAGEGFRNASTWGGVVLRHDDGVYHMWAAQMSDNCGIWAWEQNSEVWHASSADPYGPYEVRGPAISPPEAHEPIVARAPGGEYVMWYTTSLNGPGGPSTVKGGEPCDCRTSAGIAACQYQMSELTKQMPTWMSYATSPDGPWSKGRLIKVAQGNPPGMTGDTNFAGLIEPDGSVLAVGRHQVYRCAHWNDTDSCNVTAATGMAGEDPFIWFDSRNNERVLHMLRHTGRDTKNWTGNNGGHQFSRDDGLTWSGFGVHDGYPCHAEFDDGSSASFMMRERPHLVFAADGNTPLALTTGAAPGPFTGSSHNGKNDYSYTLLQKLNQEPW